MMTDKQLRALMEWMWAILRGSANLEKRAMYEAFGFVEDADGWPTVPMHPQTLPPANLATSDPEGHRQLLADLDHAAKHEAITALLAERKACNFTYHAKASDIMRLWSELKAIMEPGSMCIDQLVKMEKTDDTE